MTPKRERPRIAILTVTHNDEDELDGYFEALEALDASDDWGYEVIVVDSGSTDGTVARLAVQGSRWPFRSLVLEENRGFAFSMNRGLAEISSRVELVLSLNADARPQPGALLQLAASRQRHQGRSSGRDGDRRLRIGAVAARLVRPTEPGQPPRLDACGMRLTPSWRHLDRGSNEIDRGQYGVPELVFGATGAGSLFVREALEDVMIDGEVFDPRFHSFREDAELCFRLQARGWSVVYEPSAVITHRRFNLPDRRSSMNPEINYHALKNRYLLRIYHQAGGNWLSTAIPSGVREIGILVYVVLFERTSLAVYRWLWRHRRALVRRRREIQARRLVPQREIGRWFWRRSLPLPASAVDSTPGATV